ncbi:MAG: GNAT family N-acetyltransferase [Candidatus Bathyarchaeota archaeon]|nr:MAG: GNAT family N-acetyltransferase [Candidatus Bathyarchaeota archaeon]
MESDRVSLESAGEEDAEALAEICKRAFETDVDVGAPGEPGGPPGYDMAEAQLRLMNYLDYYKILLNDWIVGGVLVSSSGEQHRVLERIFVDPDLFRKGIGSRAMELAHALYPEAKLWTLGTPEWNVRTKAFYKKLGYVQVGWDLADPQWRGIWYERVVDSSDPYAMMDIGDLKDGMKNVDVEGEILEKSVARQVRSRRRRWETLVVANAGLGDETGRIVLVLWNDQVKQVKVGDRIRIENGYVSSYMGVNQLNVGRAGRLIILL